MRLRTLLVAPLLVWLAGCATAPAGVTYQKPGVAAADRREDENACLRSASGLDNEGLLLLPFELDRAAYGRCMEGRGYVSGPATASPAPRPR